MNPQVTVLIPTHNHGPLLLRSVSSALAQTVQDIEVLILGDGVTDGTRDCAQSLMQQDNRVRFLDYPKSPNYGEAHRHVGLREASGALVCYLADDDLWLPGHIEQMQHQILNADATHSLPLIVRTDGTFEVWNVDLALPYFRQLAFSGANRVPLACTAHSREMYDRIEGWRTTPHGRGPILDLWLQFLGHSGCRVVSGSRPTALKFQSNDRMTWTIEQRVAEMDCWVSALETAAGREKFLFDVMDAIVRDRAMRDAGQYSALAWQARSRLLSAWRVGLPWGARERIKRAPMVGPVLRELGEKLFGPIAR